MDTESMIKSLQKTIDNAETRIMSKMDSPDRDFSNCESMVDVFREISAKLEKLKEYEDLGLTVANLKEIDRLYSEQAKELMEYRKAEKEGLLLRLSCRIGETIYWINNWYGTYEDFKIDTEKVVGYKFDGEKMLIDLGGGKNGIFKETVFFTKSEAEAKLKELEGSE